MAASSSTTMDPGAPGSSTVFCISTRGGAMGGDSLGFSPATPGPVVDAVVAALVRDGLILQRDLKTKTISRVPTLMAKFKGYPLNKTPGLVFVCIMETLLQMGYATAQMGAEGHILAWERRELDPPPPAGPLCVLSFDGDEVYLSGRGVGGILASLGDATVKVSGMLRVQKEARFHRNLAGTPPVVPAKGDPVPLERWRLKFKGYPFRQLNPIVLMLSAAARIGLAVHTPLRSRTFVMSWQPDFAVPDAAYFAVSMFGDLIKVTATAPAEFFPVLNEVLDASAELTGYSVENVARFSEEHLSKLVSVPPLQIKRDKTRTNKYGNETHYTLRGYPFSFGGTYMLATTFPHVWQSLQERWAADAFCASVFDNTMTIIVPVAPGLTVEPSPHRAFSAWTENSDQLMMSALSPRPMRAAMSDYFEAVGLQIQRPWKIFKGRYGARKNSEPLYHRIKLRGYPLQREFKGCMLLRSPISVGGQVIGTVPYNQVIQSGDNTVTIPRTLFVIQELPALADAPPPTYSTVDAPPSYADIDWGQDSKKDGDDGDDDDDLDFS